MLSRSTFSALVSRHHNHSTLPYVQNNCRKLVTQPCLFLRTTLSLQICCISVAFSSSLHYCHDNEHLWRFEYFHKTCNYLPNRANHAKPRLILIKKLSQHIFYNLKHNKCYDIIVKHANENEFPRKQKQEKKKK